MSKITEPELRKKCQNLHKKLLRFEDDEMQVHGMVSATIDTINPKQTIQKLNDYLDNPNTSKTRNDLIDFIDRQGYKKEEEIEEKSMKAQEYFF